MKIVMFETEAWQDVICQCLTPLHDLRCLPTPLSEENANLFADVEAVSTFIDSKIDATTLRHMPKLRLIATRSTGHDHIDLASCHAAGVTVCNVPNYGDPTVAEYTFALLLALLRRVPEAVTRTKQGDFSRAGLRGHDLAGKVLGVVGVGRIGQRVIQIAKAFGMTILAFDSAPNRDLETQFDIRFVTLNQLLKRSDVVTLHVPGGPGTHALICERKLALMKPAAMLINTARADIVDTEALIRSLSENRLAGAALDVFSQETWLKDEAEIFRPNADPSLASLRMLAADRAVISAPNVIASAHIAYDTHEAVTRILNVTLSNIAAFTVGRPENLVGLPVHSNSENRIKSGAALTGQAQNTQCFGAAMGVLVDDVRHYSTAFLDTPDAACVHALRGALRRTRACLLMFKPLLPAEDCRWIRQELGRLTRQLGPLRDLDVLMMRHPSNGVAGPAVAETEDLKAAACSARVVAAATAQRRAGAARITMMIAGLEDWVRRQSSAVIDEAARGQMVDWLWAADARVKKAGGHDIYRGTKARHRLRRLIRTLRYNCEVHSRLFGSDEENSYIAALNHLHVLLGEMNDDAVGDRLVHDLACTGLGSRKRAAQVRARDLQGAWADFEGLQPEWTLDAATNTHQPTPTERRGPAT